MAKKVRDARELALCAELDTMTIGDKAKAIVACAAPEDGAQTAAYLALAAGGFIIGSGVFGDLFDWVDGALGAGIAVGGGAVAKMTYEGRPLLASMWRNALGICGCGAKLDAKKRCAKCGAVTQPSAPAGEEGDFASPEDMARLHEAMRAAGVVGKQ